jgi:O-glycosyl hydrolase
MFSEAADYFRNSMSLLQDINADHCDDRPYAFGKGSKAIAARPFCTMFTLHLLSLVLGLARAQIVVNPGTTYQTMDGFGFSEAFGQAQSVQNAGSTASKQALDLLFSPTLGAGCTILRNRIPETTEPNAPSGGPSGTPNYSGWDGTDQGQVWFSKQARSYGAKYIYADAWSAPAFMKTNDNDVRQNCTNGISED